MSDDFEPRLGQIGDRGKTIRYLSQVVRATRRAGLRGRGRGGQFDGSRIGRGAARARVLTSGDPHAGFRARRVVVKTRLVMLAGKGLAAAKAHLRYIERDGVTREGAPGKAYDALEDRAEGKAFLERSDGDRHQFRFIVSPEDGDQYPDLKPFVRQLMGRMEEDLGTKLDWVAVDHHNTGHPHSHIILRGKDENGQDLVIARDYISHGIREQASRIVTLDLGPRTDLEIEERLRHDMNAERLTSIDRALLRNMDEDRVLALGDRGTISPALRMGRLRKLESMGLAAPLTGDRWQLAEGLETMLRQMGERGDIIRTMQRELSARELDRVPADQRIYNPSEGTIPVVGRLIMRGLADELADRHYLLVDGTDGRTHYVAIGRGDAVDPIANGAVVQIAPRGGGVREADRTIMAVAQAAGGNYSVDAHLRHDPAASEAFAQTHVRRLEAIRRGSRDLVREADGSWIIAPDHLEKVAAHDARLDRERPVTVTVLSAIAPAQLIHADAATWLDRELTSKTPVPLREAGYGQELRGVLDARRQWLVHQQLAEVRDGMTHYKPGMIEDLRRRELLRMAGQLSEELGLNFMEARPGERIDGQLARSVELTSGRYALIERSKDFTLVPWRPVLERRVGQGVSGIMREGGIDWTFGRQRGGPGVS